MEKIVRIATRQSALALWQTEHVAERLRAAHPGLRVEVIGMTTRGDQIIDTFRYHVSGGELDSVVMRRPDQPIRDYVASALIRTDDGTDQQFRSYLLPGRFGFIENSYWYSAPILGTAPPVWSGKLIFANPIAPSEVIHLSDLPPASRFSLYDMAGQLLLSGRALAGQSISWPAAPAGVYVLVFDAPNFQPRAWRVISQ